MKDYPITIGIDDSPFHFDDASGKTSLIAVVCQGTRIMKVLKENITIDGNDSTSTIIKLVKQAKRHVQYILLDTITFGGFNICDLATIYQEIYKPIIAISEKKINLDAVKTALIKKFPNTHPEKLLKIINAGNLFETTVKTAGGISKIYFHLKGISLKEVKKLLDKICIDSKLPECIRIAHIIGRAL
ncbi:MAG: endonuclease dU [Promethearchaeota archaeon]